MTEAFPFSDPADFPFLEPLNSIPGIRAGWVERVEGVNVECDRDEAMRRLKPFHLSAVLNAAGMNPAAAGVELGRAEQVHGNLVALVPGAPLIEAPDGLPVAAGADGLVTNHPGMMLAIYAADCGAIWLADRKTGAIGLLHSGKKGTEGDILSKGLEEMTRQFGTRPEDVTAVLSPCIRPPDYEIDFAAEISRQAKRAGIGNFTDCGLNTAADLKRFYSYRKELGKTGRMMALIVREKNP